MAVRRERVVLELDDNFTAPMVKAAAAAALLNKELGGLSRDSVRTNRSVSDIDRGVTRLGATVERSGNDIDRFSGRLGLLRDALIVLGPAAVPIGAAVVPAVAGLANQLGFAALAGGTAVLTFHGVGDALKALNTYQLEPTDAHLQKLNETMQNIGPAGERFVRALDALGPQFHALQASAQAGLFPGLTDAINTIVTRAPELQRIVGVVGSTLGDLAREAGDSLAGPKWDSFFHMLETEAKPALTDIGHAVGDVVHGLAALSEAFMPLSLDFGSGLARMAADFDRWASSLSQTQGFQDFLAYIRTTGPQVLELLGSLGNAFVQLAKAAAPLGGPVLQALTAVAKAVAAIAGSNIGTPLIAAAVALTTFNRAMQGASLAQEKFVSISKKSGFATLGADLRQYLNFGVMTREEMDAQNEAGKRLGSTLGRAGASVGLLAVASSGLADKMGVANTATLAFAGSLAGPFGAAVGAAVGAILDMNAANQQSVDTVHQLGDALQAAIAAGDTRKVADMVNQIHAATAQLNGLPGPLKNGAVGDALRDLNDQADGAAAAASDVANSLGDVNQAASPAARSMQEVTQAMLDNKNAALGAFDAETQYRQALVEATKQAQKSNAGIRGNSAEALANRQALSQLAAAWNNQSDAVRNNTARFQSARKAFIQTAVDMGVPIKRARELANAVLAIPDRKAIDLSADTRQALAAIDRIKAELKSIPRSVQTRYFVTQTTRINKLPGIPLPGQSASGGPVPKDGGPYADRFPYLLAPGEYVVSNRHGQVDRYRSLLDLMNVGRLADGGIARNARTHLPEGGGGPDRNKPLFTHEGPRWYRAAYKHNRPFALDGPAHWDWPYQTSLSGAMERAFEHWVSSKRVPFDPGERITDYDMRGYYKKTRGRGWHHGSHFPDTFKTPYDTTFSHESKYATRDNPFYWHGDKLVDIRNGQVVFAAGGGFMSGPGGPADDLIPAWLSNGEYVVRAAAVDRYGRAFFDALNAERLAGGGPAIGTAISPSSGPQIGTAAYLGPARSLAEAIRALQKYLDSHDKLNKADRARLQKQLDRMNKLADAVKAFDISGVLPQQDPKNPIWAGVKAQLDDFQKAVKRAGFHWTGAMHDEQVSLLAHALKLDQLTQAQDRLKDTITEQQQAYDDLKQQMKDFGDSVAQRFTSQLFGGTDANGNPVPATVQGLIATLTGDVANMNAFGSAFNTLASKGLDTGLLNIIGQQASLADLQGLAGSTTSADIAALNQAFGNRNVASSALSQTVGFDVFGKQLGDANATLQASLAQQQANTAAINAQTTALVAGQNDIKRAVNALAPEIARLVKKG